MRISKGSGIDRRNRIEGVGLARPAVLLALAALAMVVSAPLAARQSQDLVAALDEPVRREGRQVFVKAATDDVAVDRAVDGTASGPGAVASAATTEYRYDDGSFERWTHLQDSSGQPVYEQEYAQRFRLTQRGTVANLTVCVARSRDRGSNARLPFSFTFYRDSGGRRPGNRIASGQAHVTINTPGQGGCAGLDLSSQNVRLDGGNTWVGIAWRNSSGMLAGEDTNGPGGTRTVYRSRSSSGRSWSSWTNDSVTYGIRLNMDHGGGTPPPPDPDPEPPPTTGCRPTTTALQFDGGYKVSMCYRTPDGREGQAKSGVWASSQAGLLWFFDRENAEALVKVLNGCAHNGHRWVYVAPVTDLEFNLWVTGPNGQRWTHSNRQGRTAATKADTRAFQCSNEDDDDSGDDSGDDDGDDGDDDDEDDNDDGGGDVSDALTARVTTCEGNQTAGSTWDTTIAGSVTANRSVRSVRVQGYIEPGRRQIGNQLLGSIAANQTRTFHMTGTVSGAAPTRCEVRVTGNTGAAVLRISAPMEREVREP